MHIDQWYAQTPKPLDRMEPRDFTAWTQTLPPKTLVTLAYGARPDGAIDETSYTAWELRARPYRLDIALYCPRQWTPETPCSICLYDMRQQLRRPYGAFLLPMALRVFRDLWVCMTVYDLMMHTRFRDHGHDPMPTTLVPRDL